MDKSNPDEKLARQVEAKLREDRGLGSYGLKVSVHQGKVTLQGVVDVLADKKRARKLAAEVPGVRSVEDAITLSTDGTIDDADVQMEVAEELAADPRVDPRQIGARVEGGVVHLEGRAPYQGMVRAAVEAGARARGVRDVVSHVTLDKRAEADDATLVNRVEHALSVAVVPGVDAAYIDVQVKGGVVNLKGWVKDKTAYEAAIEIASNQEGVVRVDGTGLEVGGEPPNPTRARRRT